MAEKIDKCKNCGHPILIQILPVSGEVKVFHTDKKGWSAKSCRSCGNNCDCEKPEKMETTDG